MKNGSASRAPGSEKTKLPPPPTLQKAKLGHAPAAGSASAAVTSVPPPAPPRATTPAGASPAGDGKTPQKVQASRSAAANANEPPRAPGQTPRLSTGDAGQARRGGTLTESDSPPEGNALEDGLSGPDETVTQSASPVVLEGSRIEIGERIPSTNYKVLQWLGEGSAGVVYRCEHVALERPAAIKVLRADVSPDSRRGKLFRAEARVASRTRTAGAESSTTTFTVGSPYVVDVFDFGELPDGRLWLAMELLDGQSLAQRLGRPLLGEKMDPATTIGILRQVCKGLGSAHDAGFIHRDVKPHNIMLVRRGTRDDAVKLVDFGVAAAIERSRSDDFLAGTPHYMAPEQTKGGDYDQRLDIYGLGCVAYRMLTGRPPLVGKNVMEVLRKQREEEPPPPSAIEGCEHIPPCIDDVVLRCLAKNPEDRYPNMAQVEAALLEAQIEAKLETGWDHLPLPKMDPARAERIMRAMPQPSRHGTPNRRWLAAAVAACIGLAGLTTWALMREPAETTEQANEVKNLVALARAAAARAFYVYPPADRPDEETAYRRVLQLEALDQKDADTTADELRKEFAATLVRLGDQYWDRTGGRPFAADYYAQALLFEPDNEQALERSPFSRAELAMLRKSAEQLDFSEVDLSASDVLVALAEPDEEARTEKLQQAMETEARAVSTKAALEALIEDDGQDVVAAKASDKTDRKHATAKPADASDLEEMLVLDMRGDKEQQPKAADAGDEPDSKQSAKSRSRRDPDQAEQLVEAAKEAAARADRAQAESLYLKALAADNRNGAALAGLCAVQYDLGKYSHAVRSCSRAVRASPRSATYRLRYGDALFKEFRYSEARQQYEQAQQLGSEQAEGRLAKLDKKLGG